MKPLLLFNLNDLTKTRRSFTIIALVIALLPGVILLSYNSFTNIEGPNPFFMAMIFMGGAPTAIAGILIYLIADNSLKRKLIYTVSLVLFQVLILPAVWGINDLKLKIFMFRHGTELEMIANNVLDKKWTKEFAADYTHSKGLPVELSGYIVDDETVLFFISGMIDNCHGIAYSRTGKQAYENNCGNLVRWDYLGYNWYEWATT